MSPEGPEPALPPALVLLKWLVIGLTASMIGGVIAVVWLLVTRMPVPNAPPALPAQVQLPEGVTPQAVTMGRDWVGVVTDDDRILIFTPEGRLRQEIRIAPATGG